MLAAEVSEACIIKKREAEKNGTGLEIVSAVRKNCQSGTVHSLARQRILPICLDAADFFAGWKGSCQPPQALPCDVTRFAVRQGSCYKGQVQRCAARKYIKVHPRLIMLSLWQRHVLFLFLGVGGPRCPNRQCVSTERENDGRETVFAAIDSLSMSLPRRGQGSSRRVLQSEKGIQPPVPVEPLPHPCAALWAVK